MNESWIQGTKLWETGPWIKNKFVAKYMRLARQVGLDNNPCGSRQIGVLIVDPESNAILGTGYNGPPAGTPHPDTIDYFTNFFWPQLTEDEKLLVEEKLKPDVSRATAYYNYVKEHKRHNDTCTFCPRRLVDSKSGERNELCSCQHAERNAITNAQSKLVGSWMFCWCGVPCIQCAGAIINAKIKRIHCLKAPDYHSVSRWLFGRAKIEIIEHEEKEFE